MSLSCLSEWSKDLCKVLDWEEKNFERSKIHFLFCILGGSKMFTFDSDIFQAKIPIFLTYYFSVHTFCLFRLPFLVHLLFWYRHWGGKKCSLTSFSTIFKMNKKNGPKPQVYQIIQFNFIALNTNNLIRAQTFICYSKSQFPNFYKFSWQLPIYIYIYI